MSLDSLLTGENAPYIDALYQSWLVDPGSVDPNWRQLFEDNAPDNGSMPGVVPAFRHQSIFHTKGGAASSLPASAQDMARQARVAQLINAWRVRGHMLADLDPLDKLEKERHETLTLEYYGLTESDMDVPVSGEPLNGVPKLTTLRHILQRLQTAYAGSFGVEFMNIDNNEQKLWLQYNLETLQDNKVLSPEEEVRALEKLSDAEGFERLLHTKFPGTKRFSLEGGETLIPLLDDLVEEAGHHGVKEIVIGMAHRGRLNTLVNILGKPASMVVKEFTDQVGDFQGSGDVKYHLGYSSQRLTQSGQLVHLSLAFNPSHLEAVDPVVEGRVRAKQDRHLEEIRQGKHDPSEDPKALCMPLLMHGDAAFAGQGLVAECLNLSDLAGYSTGGTIHVIVNNQIGFTTPPSEARSTRYATAVARMLAVPIFHVNGEDPEAVAAVTRIAVAWRQLFGRDVVIDMYCFRKHGHNEGDEPSFTQPLLYDAIRSHPSPREVYARHLVSTGRMTQTQVDDIFGRRRELLEQDGGAGQDSYIGNVASPMGQLWRSYVDRDAPEVDTGYELGALRELMTKANTLPKSVHAHRKVKRLLSERLKSVADERPVFWDVAEQAAFATLCAQGFRVRLSGQDSGRGTFSHRHATITDIKTGADYFPLDNLSPDQARFQVVDSLLSEAAVLGFEFGYTLDYPDALVLWEAQFGDFANGAQVIIDQFIVASEQKWNRFTGLVMLLPHGYEGQGPEHSSARIERYLMLCAEDNIQLANCTTPANFFHLLRRQALRAVRRPLIVFTPKKLLRYVEAVSTMEDLATGHFTKVFGETDDLDPAGVKRVVICQGKVYYEIREERRAREITDVALIRAELLYPFPREEIAAELARYPGAEVVFAQEEPRNMGVWPVYCDWLREMLPEDRQPRYVGRPPAASPATGYKRNHDATQAALIDDALTI